MVDRQEGGAEVPQAHGSDEELSQLLQAALPRGRPQPQVPHQAQSPGVAPEAGLSAFMSGSGLPAACLPEAAEGLPAETSLLGSLLGDHGDSELEAALQQAVPKSFDDVEDQLEAADQLEGAEALFNVATDEMMQLISTGMENPKRQGAPPLSEADVLDVARPARENAKEKPHLVRRDVAEGRPGEESPIVDISAPPKPKGGDLPPEEPQEQRVLDQTMAVEVCGKNNSVVRAGREKESEKAPFKLQAGAVIKVLEQDGNRVRYEKLSGEGPETGWISVTNSQDGSALLRETSKTVLELEEQIAQQIAEEKNRRQETLRAAAFAQQQRLEQTTKEMQVEEQIESKSLRHALTPEEIEERRVLEQLGQDIVRMEKEARERLANRLKQAAEAETLMIQDKERTQQEQEEYGRPPELPDSIWVFVSPFGQTGRRYRPTVEQICWRRIFNGPVQAAFVWDNMFFVAKEDGKLAVCDWGEPWMGDVEDWGPIFKGVVQAAWVHKDMLYVVKEEGRVAATAMGSEWDGSLEEWSHSDIFKGSVQAAFVEGTKLYVIKEGRVAVENWSNRDGHCLVEDWGRMFPRSLKTAFVAEGNLYIARARD